MGSYHQCVDLEPNEWIGEPRYCTFKFQPIVPKRPRYHNILAAIDNLANSTNKGDVSNGLAGLTNLASIHNDHTNLMTHLALNRTSSRSGIELWWWKNNQMFSHLAKKAHYFYYTKLRLATCMPSKCEKNDLELLGKQGE